MGLKLEFVRRAEAPEANLASLCREFGISRETGHKWRRRFRERGADGLEELSRRPKANPVATSEDVVLLIVETRDAHPRWGAQKIRDYLRPKLAEAPSESTVSRVLRRFNRIQKRRRRPAPNVVERAPEVLAASANEVWSVDFKGWWKSQDGTRCEPLTVRDSFSRFILCIQLMESTRTENVRAEFERLFKKHGIPRAIQSDNGPPFVCVTARAGLSRLAAWWVSLGIRIVRSRPGCPQDNGAHERMHRDLKADVQKYRASTPQEEQRACDRWRQEFNHVRPHQALAGKVPADLYRRSERRDLKPQQARYARSWLSRQVSSAGHISCGSSAYFIGSALAGYRVGLEPIEGLRHRIWFFDLELGVIDIVPDDVVLKMIDRQKKVAS